LPKSIKEALMEIDKITNTDFWQKVLEKEMTNDMVAFEFTEDRKIPVGHEFLNTITCFSM